MRLLHMLLLTLLLTACASHPLPSTPPLPSQDAATTKPAPEPPRLAPEAIPVVPEAPKPRQLTIAAVGDIMMGTDYPKNRLPDDDGVGYFRAVAPVLRAPDVTFGNLEGSLLDGGKPGKFCNNPSLCYLFRTPSRYVRHLADAGFDAVSLANNHARDFSEAGRSATMRTLDRVGMVHSGRQGDIAKWEVDGHRLALIAFAPNPGSHSLLDIDHAASLVANLGAEHDIVLVSFHGGKEGLGATHLTFRREFFYGEDRGDVVAFARAVIDAGADLVLGHGSHVPRPLEVYRGQLIAYSLGNFATHYGISVKGIKGIAPILLATLAPDGRFLEGQIISTRQVRPHGPQLDPEQRALKLIRQLSRADLGSRAPVFTDDGRIRPPAPADVVKKRHVDRER